MSRKLLAWYVIPVCLFLVTMGMKVPNLANLHSAPKPRPRAIIETTSKSSQYAAAREIQAFELCDNVPKLLPPLISQTAFRREVCQFISAATPKSGARAPPFFRC